METLTLAIIVYAAIVLGYAALNRSEFSRSPEKAQRYRALPLRYKAMCWFGVLPMFAASVVVPIATAAAGFAALGFVALIMFALVEAACISWYRKQGLW